MAGKLLRQTWLQDHRLMIARAGSRNGFRKGFVRQVAIPITLVMIVIAGAGFLGLKSAANQSDTISVRQQIKMTERALSTSVDELTFDQQAVSFWPDLIAQLNRPVFDMQWLDENIGYMGFEAVKIDHSYILNDKDEPIYASIAGRYAPAASFDAVREQLGPMVDRVRGRGNPRNGPHDRLPGQPLAPDSTVQTSPDSIHDSGLAAISGRPAAVAVILIQYPSNWKGPRLGRGGFLLISVRFLDGANLRDIGNQNLISGLRFSQAPDMRAGERRIVVSDDHGGKVGYFFWHPDLPGTKLLNSLVPIAVGAFAACAFLMALLARSLWRSGRRLDETFVELLASRAQAQHLAFHDVLTGLPNRAMFDDRLDQALASAHKGKRIALLALDLDRFKHVNDTLGHAAGDQLIREFADRLSGVLCSTDSVARIGGDEFAVLLSDIGGQHEAHACCERILEIVQRPFEIFGNQIFVGVSIGVAMAPEAGLDRGELTRKADIALYRAKDEGRERHCFFTPMMDETVKFRGAVEDELRQAIASCEDLKVYYQPQVSPEGMVVGLEALVRWDHPTRGFVPPSQFIPIAEETGIICALGEWVMSEAFGVARRWPDLFVAVNLSPVQFRSPGFAQRVIDLAEQAGCDPRRIELEVTEGVLIDDHDQCFEALETLRAAGFRIALDDFGTGYSSLNYLRNFHVDKIKIDQSFTKGIGSLSDAGAIVASVVNLGHAMGLSVAAEGVETADQMEFLSEIGCNEFQGYLFSHAVAEEDLNKIIKERAAHYAAPRRDAAADAQVVPLPSRQPATHVDWHDHSRGGNRKFRR